MVDLTCNVVPWQSYGPGMANGCLCSARTDQPRSARAFGFRGVSRWRFAGWWVVLCGHQRRRLAKTLGSVVLISDRNTPIGFGMLGSDPEIVVAWRAGDPCWYLENDGRRERWPEFARCTARDEGEASGGGTVPDLQAGGWSHGLCCIPFGLGLVGSWDWAWVSWYSAQVQCYIYVLLYCFLFSISPYRVQVGVCGLGPSKCTLCAWSALSWWRVPCFGKWSQLFSSSNVSALGRRRVPCLVKWSLPPSGRVKLSVVGCFIPWQHDGKAIRIEIMLSCNRVADQVIFPLCHCCMTYVKANRDASRALFASWCLLGYMFVVEAPVIISGSSLAVICSLGFRYHVPPMYSAVSLINA